jgi:GNAT superfamily N-acetyltransferase
LIRFFEEKDKESVVSLWHEAFGDKKEEIAVYIEFFGENLLVCENDGQIVSMMTLIKTAIGTEKGRYVYAVATGKKFRGMGFASRLIDFAKQYISANNEKFLVLVPQEASLFDFYKKRGFYELCCSEKIKSKTHFNKKTNIIIDIISEKEYFDFRNIYFSGERYAKWGIEMLEFMKKIYDGNFFALKKGNKVFGAGFCYNLGDFLVISELLQRGNHNESIDALVNFFEADRVVCVKEKKHGDKFAMIYPQKYTDAYFGLAMK